MTTAKAYTGEPIAIDLPMPILIPRLIIRPPQPGDGQALASAVEETWDDLHPWFHLYMDTKTQETNARWKEAFVCRARGDFESRTRMILFAFDRWTNQFVLSTGFHNPQWRVGRFEIDYWVTKSRQGEGLATEAANALVRYAFANMPARVITVGHAEGNHASRSVIEKLGFTYAIRKPHDCEMPDGSLVDGHGYYRLNSEGLPALDVSWGNAQAEKLHI